MEEEDYTGWPFIASMIYTFAWSISFYGQTYENFKHKSYFIEYLVLKDAKWISLFTIW